MYQRLRAARPNRQGSRPPGRGTFHRPRHHKYAYGPTPLSAPYFPEIFRRIFSWFYGSGGGVRRPVTRPRPAYFRIFFREFFLGIFDYGVPAVMFMIIFFVVLVRL
jgi:hypothetical protein